MREAVRVALLARPGAGADRLREALQSAGASLVLDADPTALDAATLAGAGAESVVVLLDPVVEDALDRLDPVLHDPGIDVLYEEAEVAAAREGWDVARWTRHLSAKLMRHGDVLPPGREQDAPPDPVRDEPPGSASAPSRSAFDPVAAEYEFDFDPGQPMGLDMADAMDPVDAAHEPDAPRAFDADGPGVAGRDDSGPDAAGPDAAGPSAPSDDTATPADQPDWSALTLSLDGDAQDAAATPAAPTAASGAQDDPPGADAPADPPSGRGSAIRDFRRDLADIEQRIASMGLVDDGPDAANAAGETASPAAGTPEPDGMSGLADAPDAPQAPFASSTADVDGASDAPATAARPAGAVLVFAGIGGPDAVRQFLGALPPAFPRPVLILQRLDGGRYDRLVQQMARATTLPVDLAEPGKRAVAGHVYILPPELGLAGEGGGLRFVADGDPMATLSPADSAVLMFSGSDTGLVEAAMQHAAAGALVAGQSPDGCYDAAAPDALVARGAESGQPAELARRLAVRWAA